jgi:hypothetical protein
MGQGRRFDQVRHDSDDRRRDVLGAAGGAHQDQAVHLELLFVDDRQHGNEPFAFAALDDDDRVLWEMIIKLGMFS